MLPDHYENLSQSVIAGNLMSQNILSAITTKNYWDVVNEYKPLMHLWYVGILFEFYIVLSIIMICANKCSKFLRMDGTKVMICVLTIFILLSLTLYLNPLVSTGNRFYLLQYRFFELGIGGLIALLIEGDVYDRSKSKISYVQTIFSLCLIAVIFCSWYCLLTDNNPSVKVPIGARSISFNGLPISSTSALLLTVMLTSIVVACRKGDSIILKSNVLAWVGKMSYSIFIWHQVLLAWYRYSIAYDMNFLNVMIYLFIVLVLSVASYYFIEKKISSTHQSFIGWSIAAMSVMIPSGYIYIHAGVVRDVPELDVVKGTEHRGMFGEYCDRVYGYKKYPEMDNGKPNVLVNGISFGRDFANVILESEYKDSVNLVYAYTWDDYNVEELVKQSDYIFTFTAKDDIPSKVWDNMKASCRIKGIGTKNYGACNGTIYKNRSRSDYFGQVALIEDGYIELNNEWKRQWGKDYIDLIKPLLVDDKYVKVFTDDNRYISQDCRHLTKAGAKWYAKILDWNIIFE